jgi:hypothetical protein
VVPLPSIPYLPPLSLPIPGIVIPTLPTLPKFDLGSLEFLCGLIRIDLPVLDPFAGLNDLVNKLNASISALNQFLNFCNENANVINATEIPPEDSPSI